MSVWMSLIEFSLTTTIRGIRLATRPCIFTNEYQRPIEYRLRRVGACVHLELAVLGDRVVQRDDRRDQRLDLQDPVAEALVVVDEVELADARLAALRRRAGAERQRLGERAGRELGELRAGPRGS